MRKLTSVVIFMALFTFSLSCFSATLNSMNKTQFQNAFINKTAVSIPTDNLNGKDINNVFSMFMDGKGHIWGAMATKPDNEPQTDTGVYTIDKDGAVYLNWKHWDGAKKLCFYIFETKNAYITIDCNKVFHSVFMKSAIQPGNHLQ